MTSGQWVFFFVCLVQQLVKIKGPTMCTLSGLYSHPGLRGAMELFILMKNPFFFSVKFDHFSHHTWYYLTVHSCAVAQWLQNTDPH